MRESSENSGSAAIFFTLLLITLLLLIVVGTGMTFMYLRQVTFRQEAVLLQEMAMAEEARALAAAEQAKAQAAAVEQAAAASVAKAELDSEFAGADRDDANAIRKLLVGQQAAWNRKDIEAFMQAYWNSEELVVTLDGKVLHGWKAVSDSRHELSATSDVDISYRDLQLLHVDENAGLMTGRVVANLGDEEEVSELTLFLRRIDDRWLIVHQHESRRR